jgi:hypothetical protein
MIKRLALFSTVATVCWVTGALHSADAVQNPENLAKALAGADAAKAKLAVEEIRTRLIADPEKAGGDLRRWWIKPLKDTHRYDDIVTLAVLGIVGSPYKTGEVDFLQEARVRALLAGGKPQEALSQAKALFDFAPLRSTEKALLLLAECLAANHDGDSKLVRQLTQEQTAGAAPRPFSDPPSKGGLLAEIPVDATVYQAAIDRLTGQDERSRVGKGNLLLLSGRPGEAKEAFEKAAPRNDTPSLIAYYENIARAMRAQDGNIGRANSYMLAVPEKHLHPTLEDQGKF